MGAIVEALRATVPQEAAGGSIAALVGIVEVSDERRHELEVAQREHRAHARRGARVRGRRIVTARARVTGR